MIAMTSLALRPLRAALAVGVTAAIPFAAPQQAPPSTRATEPFAVEFLALGSDGRPAEDLTRAEVQLKLDGRVRTVRSLEWVPIFDARTADGRPALPLPPPYGSSAAHDGIRTVLFVVDDYSFRPGRERPLREVLDRFLAGLASRDRVALATLPYGGLETDLTAERERVLAALARVSGQGPESESGSELACRTRRTLESLTGLLESLRGGEGPTTVVFFSSRLAGPRRDAVATRAPGGCELTVDHFRRVGDAASSARVLFYIVQPDDVMLQRGANQTEGIAGGGFLGSDNPLEGLEHLGGVTGARRLQLQTPEDAALERIRRETAGYYLLRFDADPSDRAGLRRQIDLRVSRPGSILRVRPQFTVPLVERSLAPPTPHMMLRGGRVFRGLPIRTVGYVSRNPDDDTLKVVVIVEPLETGVRLASVAAALVDQAGRLVSQWTAPDTEVRPLIGALTAQPGAYRLRVAATDASGRAGTADYEIRAELAPAGPLTLSGLALGLARGAAFAPRMEFGDEPSAMAYLELYGRPGSDAMWVSFELARTLNGPALVTTPGVIDGTRWPHQFVARGAIPIHTLPPGDYVVRAVGGIKGQPAGRVVRTLRKIAAASTP